MRHLWYGQERLVKPCVCFSSLLQESDFLSDFQRNYVCMQFAYAGRSRLGPWFILRAINLSPTAEAGDVCKHLRSHFPRISPALRTVLVHDVCSWLLAGEEGTNLFRVFCLLSYFDAHLRYRGKRRTWWEDPGLLVWMCSLSTVLVVSVECGSLCAHGARHGRIYWFIMDGRLTPSPRQVTRGQWAPCPRGNLLCLKTLQSRLKSLMAGINALPLTSLKM